MLLIISLNYFYIYFLGKKKLECCQNAIYRKKPSVVFQQIILTLLILKNKYKLKDTNQLIHFDIWQIAINIQEKHE